MQQKLKTSEVFFLLATTWSAVYVKYDCQLYLLVVCLAISKQRKCPEFITTTGLCIHKNMCLQIYCSNNAQRVFWSHMPTTQSMFMRNIELDRLNTVKVW